MKRLLGLLLGMMLLWSCEKDNITRSVSEAQTRQNQLVNNLKNALQNAPDGWVMMVKSNLSDKIYTPLVMKFDTLKNKVDIVTVYSLTDETPAYFEIGEDTANPLLIFSTGSIVTSMYRLGAQAADLTDHMFKVIGVSADEIILQCYRSGQIYSPEGGTIYRLFKRPANWKWADKERYFDLDNVAKWKSDFLNLTKYARLDLKYTNGEAALSMSVNGNDMGDLAYIRRSDPFDKNISAKGFLPIVAMRFYFANGTQREETFPFLGHNSLAFYPFDFRSTSATSSLVNLIAVAKTHYLVVKSVNKTASQLDMELEAYDKNGDAVVQGTYSLR